MKTVLYVDDEQPNLFLFEMTFRRKANIVTAKSAEEAAGVLKSRSDIDLVISDMRMPGTNGLEFIGSVYKQYPQISFYLLTGFDNSDEIDLAVSEHKIKKYLKKPFDREEILALLD